MNCTTVPKTRCPRCGGPWWHENYRGVYHSCFNCGYVPERVHSDPEFEAELRLEARRREPSRILAPAGFGTQVRYRLAGVDAASLATLRAMA